MSLRSLRGILLAAAAVALPIVSCGQRSLVLVDVAAEPGATIPTGTLVITAGSEKVSFDEVSLGSFKAGIYLPAGTSGKVTVTGEVDADNCVVGTGAVDMADEPDVSAGKTTTAVSLVIHPTGGACTPPDGGSPGPGGATATGGTTGTGGSPGTGGATATGGTKGGTGGVRGTGGSTTGAGGASTGTGGMLGGAGGVKGTGGATMGTGGATGVGGVKGTGGDTTGAGGMVGTGGVKGTGGVVGTGGAPNTGGVSGTGGSTGSGGVGGVCGLCPVGYTCDPTTMTCRSNCSTGSGGITALDETGQVVVCPLD